jgi:hypothetical protein
MVIVGGVSCLIREDLAMVEPKKEDLVVIEQKNEDLTVVKPEVEMNESKCDRI